LQVLRHYVFLPQRVSKNAYKTTEHKYWACVHLAHAFLLRVPRPGLGLPTYARTYSCYIK